MARNKIFVNIHNVGKIFGLKTPAYNVPFDYGTYELLREMGVEIEIVDPFKKKKPNPENVVSIEPVKKKVKKPRKVVLELGDFVANDVYSEDDLKDLSKPELVRILNYRGHYSSRTGKRDPLAPKYDDNKTILISKILKTNLK